MFALRQRDGKASVKTVEKKTQNEGLTTDFCSLPLVKRLLFMTGSVELDFWPLFSR